MRSTSTISKHGICAAAKATLCLSAADMVGGSRQLFAMLPAYLVASPWQLARGYATGSGGPDRS